MHPRIARHVEVSECGCWIWTGYADPGNGYPKNGPEWAHRLSYELHVGPIPSGLTIDHLCRTPLCVNPRIWSPSPSVKTTSEDSELLASTLAKRPASTAIHSMPRTRTAPREEEGNAGYADGSLSGTFERRGARHERLYLVRRPGAHERSEMYALCGHGGEGVEGEAAWQVTPSTRSRR